MAAMSEALKDLIALLDLEQIELNLYRGVSPDEDRQRVFGGQVAGQALVAAARTVDDRERLVHSLHAYFLRPGDPRVPIVYEVDRLRDGRSFSTRRVVAVQHAAAGVRVNCVVPGQLHTPMVEARLAGQRTGGDVDTLLAQRLQRIPLGFMGDGRDTASAALFLASDEARFITGTELVVDGGMTARCD